MSFCTSFIPQWYKNYGKKKMKEGMKKQVIFEWISCLLHCYKIQWMRKSRKKENLARSSYTIKATKTLSLPLVYNLVYWIYWALAHEIFAVSVIASTECVILLMYYSILTTVLICIQHAKQNRATSRQVTCYKPHANGSWGHSSEDHFSVLFLFPFFCGSLVDSDNCRRWFWFFCQSKELCCFSTLVKLSPMQTLLKLNKIWNSL